MSKKTEQEAPPEIIINRSWCKGCKICVELCPQGVLAMEDNYPVVVNLSECNRCDLCDLRCPDFAITVS